ncbi:hypothetical protein HCZ87_20070 [Phaeobacter sp. HF9A]|nr:hypothetical protein [Phaeobacter sp. HF9A]
MTPVFTAPAGHYFFLGDNRDNSADSRMPLIAGGAGFIAGENLVGPVARVLVSEPAATYWAVSNWRWSRVFKEIK